MSVSEGAGKELRSRNRMLAALIGFFTMVVIGYVVMGALINPRLHQECYGLGLLFCIAQALPLVALVATIVEVIFMRWILRKWGIGHPVAIAIFSPLTMFLLYLVSYRIWSELQLNIWAHIAICGVFFIASFLFYNWYLNERTGKFSSKILRIIAGLGAVAITGVLLNFYV